MAKENVGIQMPGAFGGIMRYNDEYSSLFNIKPAHVIAFIILIVLARIALPFVF